MSYKVLDVPQSLNCQHCVPCMRIRLMEMGFIEGQEIEIEKAFAIKDGDEVRLGDTVFTFKTWH